MFADVLRDTRKKRGLTQKDLGILVGRSKQVISRLESGSGGVSIEMTTKLAKALQVNPNIFLPKKYLK